MPALIYMCTRAHSAREFMAFTSEVLVGRTAAGQRQTVKEQGTLVELTARVLTTTLVLYMYIT